MTSVLSNLVNILSEVTHQIKCKYKQDDKWCEICVISYVYNCFLEYINFTDDLIQYNCSCCEKNYQNYEKLKEQFFNIYKFSNHDNNTFIFIVAKSCLSFWIYGWLEKIQ